MCVWCVGGVCVCVGEWACLCVWREREEQLKTVTVLVADVKSSELTSTTRSMSLI